MKNILKVFLILFSLSCCFSSCVTTRDTNLLQDIETNYPELTVKPEEYKIIPGDQLSIFVYAWDDKTARMFAAYAPNFSWQGLNDATGVAAGIQVRHLENVGGVKPVTVYADGTITFPYIGKVYVKGYTLLEARKVITERLDRIQAGTTAEVALANKFFSILGEAGANRITMTGNSMSLFQALAIANTIGPYGDRSKVTIIRQTETGSQLRTIDIRSKDIIDTEYYYIQPNDVIYIPQKDNKFFGSTTSFTGVFSLLTSIATVIIFTIRIF